MSDLKQTLGIFRGTGMMLNIVLGAGLLTLPGLAYREVGAEAVWIWLACGSAAIPLLVVFAMIGRLYPDAGGIPALAGRIFGHRAYVMSTFLFFGAVALGLPAIAITGGYYASAFIDLSPYLLAACILVCAALVNLLSAELAGRAGGTIASMLIAVLLAVVIFGFVAVGAGSEARAITGPTLQHDMTTYAAVFMMVFFAFTGWEVAAHLSEEFKRPARDFPLAMAFSFVIAIAFYLALAIIIARSNISDGYEAPFAALFTTHYGENAGLLVAAAAVLLIFANLSAAVWAVSRMVLSTARAGLLPASLARTTNGTPLRSVLVVVVMLVAAIGLAGFGYLPLGDLLAYAGQNFLILYGIAALVLLFAVTDWRIRGAALVAITTVLAVMTLRDPLAMLYPAALVTLGALVPRPRNRAAPEAERS